MEPTPLFHVSPRYTYTCSIVPVHVCIVILNIQYMYIFVHTCSVYTVCSIYTCTYIVHASIMCMYMQNVYLFIIYICIHVHVFMYTNTCKRKCKGFFTQTCTYTYVYIYIYILIYSKNLVSFLFCSFSTKFHRNETKLGLGETKQRNSGNPYHRGLL
jgi:hypothetical protein